MRDTGPNWHADRCASADALQPGHAQRRIFFVPGVIGVVLQIGTTVAAAMALVRERERGTLEQLLVSPLSPARAHARRARCILCIGMTMRQ